MNNSNRTSDIIGVILYVLIVAAITYITANALWLTIMLPPAIALLHMRQGWQVGAFANVFIIVIFFKIIGVAPALLLTTVMVATTITYGFIDKKTTEQTIQSAVLSMLVNLFIFEVLMPDYSLLSAIKTAIDSYAITPELTEILNQMSLNGSVSGSAETIFNDLKQMFSMIVPAVCLMLFTIYSILIYRLDYWLLTLLKLPIAKRKALRNIRLPGNPIIGTSIIIFTALAASLFSQKIGDLMIINVFYIVLFIFALQGLSSIAYIAHRTGINKILQILLIGVAIMLLQLIGLAIAGWIDLTFGTGRTRRGGKWLWMNKTLKIYPVIASFLRLSCYWLPLVPLLPKISI